MESKSSIIIAVVAIAIAAIAAFAIVNNDDNGEKVRSSNNLDGRLTVFGNANNDDFLDERDVDFVKKIVAGEEKATYFPVYKSWGDAKTLQRSFADANCDGKIDRADVDWIQDMVDRRENMLVYFYDVDGVVGSCTYPLSTAAVGYKSNYESLLILGAQKQVLYACDQVKATGADNGKYHMWYTAFDGAKPYGSRFNPDYEVFTAPGNEKPSFILSGTRAWFDSEMEEKCGPLGIDVVRLPFYEDNWTVPAVITLGYLLQKEEAAYDYANTADSVFETIGTAMKDVPISERPYVFASYQGTSVAKMHSGIQEMVYLAGGQTPLDRGHPAGSVDAEAIWEMDPEWIVLDQSGPYYGFLETFTNTEDIRGKEMTALTQTDLKYIDAIDHTAAYREGRVLFLEQGIYMGPADYIAVAFVANHIHGDRFDFDVDRLFRDYVSRYHPEFDPADFEGIEYFTLKEVNDWLARRA